MPSSVTGGRGGGQVLSAGPPVRPKPLRRGEGPDTLFGRIGEIGRFGALSLPAVMLLTVALGQFMMAKKLVPVSRARLGDAWGLRPM